MTPAPEPQDGEAVEQPELDPISDDALTILLEGIQERAQHTAWHVDRHEYSTIMLHLRGVAHTLNVAYKLAEALLEEKAKAN